MSKSGFQKMHAPSIWITRFAKLAPKGGQVLDLACGSGRHCDYFLDLGHPVTALDRDVGKLTSRDRLEIIQHDLEGGGPWPLENRQFSVVVVVNFLFRPLLPTLISAVAPGGLLLYDTFAVGNEAFGRPNNPDFLLQAGELKTVVAEELSILNYFHGPLEQPKPAIKQRICARRPLKAG